MIFNYLKLAIRLMGRNPFFTGINFLGLSMGFAVFFILWPFSQSELSSDQFIKDYERIERPYMDYRWTDDGGANWGHLNFPFTLSSVGSELRGHDQIEDVTRFLRQNGFHQSNTPGLERNLVITLDNDDQFVLGLRHDAAICTDANFITFFDFHTIAGNPVTALTFAEGVVITETLAQKIFDGDALGKQIKCNGKPFEVTAVIKDLPRNSHLQFEMIFSNQRVLDKWDEGLWQTAYVYCKMKSPGQLADLMNENKARLVGRWLEKNPQARVNFFSQPVSELAFSQMQFEPFKTKSRFTIRILAAVAVVILVMAWLNYVNLTVSRSRSRFKEIATRKVAGALLPDLFIQFVCQSALINVIAALIGTTFAQLVRTPFRTLLNIDVLPINEWSLNTITFFVMIFLSGILLTALYPTYITWKNTTSQLLVKNVPARKRIVTTLFTTVQYVSALSLIAWIFVMNDQLNFILDKDIGIARENVLVVEAPIVGLEENRATKITALANYIRSGLGKQELCLSGRVCGEGAAAFEEQLRPVGSDIYFGIDSQGGVDENFIPFYDLKVIAGRNFVKDEKDSVIILSRLASDRLGFSSPERAVGSFVEYSAGGWKKVKIIGVIEDYRVSAYYAAQNNTEVESGRGLCLTYMDNLSSSDLGERISVKVDLRTMDDFLAKFSAYYNAQFPGNPFNWYFLDEKVRQQYGDQKIARNQITLFTALAVVVACLGLLGMIANTVTEKIKEISIRKILGARIHHISKMLLKTTLTQIAIAVVIGMPIAWQLSQGYLQRYTERVDLQWWHFLMPIVVLITIMLVTVASVVLKAVKTNPVDALKHE
jgi:putative ABC transport system permease protein